MDEKTEETEREPLIVRKSKKYLLKIFIEIIKRATGYNAKTARTNNSTKWNLAYGLASVPVMRPK